MSKTYTAESITKDLTVQGFCNFPGIGKLEVVHRPARDGRNPITGEPMKIAAKKAVVFRASSVIKKALNAK